MIDLNITKNTSAIRQNSKTFHLASLFLGKKTAHNVARLYAFCRLVDDLADKEPNKEWALTTLNDWKTQIQTHSPTTPIVEDILNLAKDKDLDKKAITLLIDGVISDLNCVHIANEEDLTRYSFQVAGTVGMLMNQLLGSKEACAKKFAIDLGIAMQLTNILRDVAEDASLGRQYIPQSWLPQGLDFLNPTDAQNEALKTSFHRLFLLAEQYYQSGYAGIRYLPIRNRFCVLLAARMYQEIGKRGVCQDFIRWEKRMIVPKSSKFKLMCLCSLDFLKSLFSVKKPIRHDESLHHVFTQWLNPE